MLQSEDGHRHDELRFPVPRLRPAGGFSIDPTLVYALTRLESNFDPAATSPAGARGLMQIMPATAQYITGDLFYAPHACTSRHRTSKSASATSPIWRTRTASTTI